MNIIKIINSTDIQLLTELLTHDFQFDTIRNCQDNLNKKTKDSHKDIIRASTTSESSINKVCSIMNKNDRDCLINTTFDEFNISMINVLKTLNIIIQKDLKNLRKDINVVVSSDKFEFR